MKKSSLFFPILWLLVVIGSDGLAQQIPIARVERMPNMPQPYAMRDWRQVALGYDSLVFDLNRTGQYLPLIRWNVSTINYPNHPSFGLHTVVGTTHPGSAEAINVLPAVIGASLVGVDKSNQDGVNWVLMCEEFFNRRPEENIYLNHPVTSSGDDWWYETMPNIFFYQLFDRYPNTGDFARQFTLVADQWLRAVEKMGASATPWRYPYMNYRAWSLSTMKPNTSDVPEPEAAGAIAWILYHAFVHTGDFRYRIGAEWCLEFLQHWGSNPSYELQLPYGALVAARMNAELGTDYNIEKFLNWCFDVGPLRQWGVIVGNWGGYDCHGLVGEASGDGYYAFAMNGFEQIGALVPLVRYDDRFARAIGKWVLNAANAARLFYTHYLPDKNQDSEAWSHQYDPHSYIAHEALRRSWQGQSPYATGDAIAGGWGATNLALYGSSHVGILGAIIDTTRVEKILRLDVLKTDYFQAPAYPSYLYYNPYPEAKLVELELETGQFDLYDAVSNQFLQTGVSGTVNFAIPADAARLLVIIPTGGKVHYHLDQMWVDGVIVDYRSGQTVANYPPRIKALAAARPGLLLQQTTTVYCTAMDRDQDALTFFWHSTGGIMTGSGAEINWQAPTAPGVYEITCRVSDGKGGQDSSRISLSVSAAINHAPTILKISARPRKIDLGASTIITCRAADSDGDSLTYFWQADAGQLEGADSTVVWTAPVQPGNYTITCRVEDNRGGLALDSIRISVRDFSAVPTGDLVSFYPFNGDASDASGFANHGTVYGATLAPDRRNQARSALSFDGVNDYIRVANNAGLNFQNAITVCFWVRIGTLYNREAFIISHGSWENRWKVSLIPEKKLRWTIKTNQGITDLDSENELAENRDYYFVLVYTGADFEIYLNGELDAFSSWSGALQPTSFDLTIGQRLPNDANYNFKGILDEIRIYNFGLAHLQIQTLYQEQTAVKPAESNQPPDRLMLFPNHPNPFNHRTVIHFQIPKAGMVYLRIYDILGKRVRTLIAEERPAGNYQSTWDGKGENQQEVASGVYLCELQMNEQRQRIRLLLIK